MKGIELPVNTLVVIAIAVLVMLGLIAMYMAGLGPFEIVVEMGAKSAACNELVSMGCGTASLSGVPIDYGEYTSLEDYCEAKHIGAYPGSYDFATDPPTYQADIDDVSVDTYCRTVICGCPA